MASTSSQNKTTELKKRKLADEKRTFQEKWTNDYFFVESNTKALCLICRDVVAVFKEYNLRRHYTQMHIKFDEFKGVCRKQKLQELKGTLTSQQQQFRKFISQSDSLVKASYVVANLIAKRSKPFADGEFVKECLESVADIICPEKKSEISKISLSRQTIARRIEGIAQSTEAQVAFQCTNFKFFSMALDESTDATDTAQLAIFIRGIDKDFNITEELASLVPLKDTTKSVDLYEAVKATLLRFSLTIDNMSGIATDGAPAMIGKQTGLTKLVEDNAKSIGNIRFMKYHED